MSTSTTTTMHLQSADGIIFQVDLEDVKCSGTIMALLEKKKGGEKDHEAVYLEKINCVILQKVLEWTKHHKDNPNPAHGLKGAGDATVVGEWDKAYLDRQDPGDLFELILAAEYLKIKGLLDLIADKLMRMFNENSVQEVRNTFGVKNDFTQEEYEKILKENEIIRKFFL